MIVRAKLVLVLSKLQSGDRRHAAVVEDHDRSARAMFDGIDQDLRVHHERSVAGKRNSVPRFVGQCRGQQGAGREAHIGSAGFGERFSGPVVLDNLETVGLHITGIEEFGGGDLFRKIGDDLYRCRL